MNNIQPHLEELNESDIMGYNLSSVLTESGRMYKQGDFCWALIHPYSKMEGRGVLDGELAVDINPETLEVIQIEPAQLSIRDS